ncbi:cullin-associated NEDD8-dissociated protein 1-like [Artemia franciscana]|uniref:Cullin-associated NEDD8-dissociated protein 1 n=1 Tax=Artemia franciscana TaxID=6661 RepID=A0AA88I0S7_ARTSF|nr:hypothetical protein QYM36_006003 [Artemia franciscana]
MCSNDKDFRFMATNDLMSELQKDSIKLDDDSERKVVRMLMKLLEDKNGEVQNLAVKCLGPLVSKVKDSQVEVIVETLCSNMSSSKEQLRDISSIGLKTVIAELPLSASGLAAAVCKKITGRLSETIAKKEDVAIQLEAIEIMSDLLCRFGTLLVPYHGMIMESLLPQLSSARMAVIKRTITAISYLVLTCNAQLYEKLIQYLIDGLTRQQDIYRCKSYVLCLGSICRQAGHRLGEHIEKVLPLVFDNIKKNDDDLTEYCLQTLESFIYRCSKEITPHVHQVSLLYKLR